MPIRKEALMSKENKKQPEIEKLSIEDAFGRLDTLLEKMEDKNTSLEDAFALYQQGMELLKHCNEKIDTVEKKIQIMNGDGGLDEF